MQEGSTIDLSERTAALPLVSAFTNTDSDRTLKFADGATVYVAAPVEVVVRGKQQAYDNKTRGVVSDAVPCLFNGVICDLPFNVVGLPMKDGRYDSSSFYDLSIHRRLISCGRVHLRIVPFRPARRSVGSFPRWSRYFAMAARLAKNAMPNFMMSVTPSATSDAT